MADENNHNPLDENQNPPSRENDRGSNIPEWMREAGWETDSGTFDESKPVFDDLEGEQDIVPAEIPAWLEEAAPEGFKFGVDSGSDPIPPAVEDPLDSLVGDSLGSEELESAESIELTPVESDKPSSSPSEPHLDIPSWLKDLELDEDSQETAVTWLENMPESLRATEEELEISRQRKPEITTDPVDEFSWMDETPTAVDDSMDSAKLSENLISADLLPEENAEEKIFATEELKSFDSNLPSWMDELDGTPPTKEEDPGSSSASAEIAEPEVNLMPDWLSELNDVELDPDSEPTPADPVSVELESDSLDDIPDWLGNFEAQETLSEPESDSGSLAWLDSLGSTQAEPEDDLLATQTESEPTSSTIPDPDFEDDLFQDSGNVPETVSELSSPETVSPNDDTLNTAFPDWLSKISDEDESDLSSSESEEPASWLSDLEKQPTGELRQEDPARDSDVVEWLEGRDSLESLGPETEAEAEIEAEADIDLDGPLPEAPPEIPAPPVLETAKYLTLDDDTDSLPDWLSELEDKSGDQDRTLESALRQSEHDLSEDELDFLGQADEAKEDNADWLAKLDLVEEQDAPVLDTPAIKEALPDQTPPQKTAETEQTAISGGILDRLKDTGAIGKEPEVPQWLENLKKEEDPQETAILWLKQFVEQGDHANLSAEIKRYTDELNPGDTVPTWMEDLKNEEDPQTTAMLWLEKLSGERPPPPKPKSKPATSEDTDWLTALEKEEAEQAQVKSAETSEDFLDNSEDWLSDLEIDEKIKPDGDQLPDWTAATGDGQGSGPEGDTPLWMKATSPLEGDFNTDELAGTEKEVEIPEWLAGYGEGEQPPPESPTQGTAFG